MFVQMYGCRANSEMCILYLHIVHVELDCYGVRFHLIPQLCGKVMLFFYFPSIFFFFFIVSAHTVALKTNAGRTLVSANNEYFSLVTNGIPGEGGRNDHK